MQILVLIGTVGASPDIGEILPLCDFFDCPVLFFSGTRLGRTAEPIFTLYGSNDVFPRKEMPFRG